MHGLVNRSIQCFLRDTYGDRLWAEVARDTGVGDHGFEAMLIYDDRLTTAVLDAAARLLDRPREMLLEDLGTYLVSHPTTEALRRLLRFGGVDYRDFLHSLDDLQGRGRLAVPDLDLPLLQLCEGEPGHFTLRVTGRSAGVGHVLIGLLRAMADDYGALVLLDHLDAAPAPMGTMTERIGITLLDESFAEGRDFVLAAGG